MYLQLYKHKGFQKILIDLYESSRNQDTLLDVTWSSHNFWRHWSITAFTPFWYSLWSESFFKMIFSKKQNVLMMSMSSYFPNQLNTGPEPLLGKGRGARTALYGCHASCPALVMGLSRDCSGNSCSADLGQKCGNHTRVERRRVSTWQGLCFPRHLYYSVPNWVWNW